MYSFFKSILHFWKRSYWIIIFGSVDGFSRQLHGEDALVDD